MKPLHEKLPNPSYWPFFLAIGFTFLLWGVISHWLVSVAGLVLVIFALNGWIKDLRNESRE